jgi:hypothetical protein
MVLVDVSWRRTDRVRQSPMGAISLMMYCSHDKLVLTTLLGPGLVMCCAGLHRAHHDATEGQCPSPGDFIVQLCRLSGARALCATHRWCRGKGKRTAIYELARLKGQDRGSCLST